METEPQLAAVVEGVNEAREVRGAEGCTRPRSSLDLGRIAPEAGTGGQGDLSSQKTSEFKSFFVRNRSTWLRSFSFDTKKYRIVSKQQ
jgi:hypothetical protein